MQLFDIQISFKGSIKVRGKEIRKPGADRSVIFQNTDAALFPWKTVWENSEFGLKLSNIGKEEERESLIRTFLKKTKLEGHEHKYPHELSGGMQQRAALCRALIHNPSLLLLDEPFGSLDAMTREQLNLEFLKLLEYQKTTRIFVTHSITEAIFLADRVIVMGPRPGTTVGEIQIHFPRPRASSIRDDEEFITLSRRIRDLINHKSP